MRDSDDVTMAEMLSERINIHINLFHQKTLSGNVISESDQTNNSWLTLLSVLTDQKNL
jgi:hypothetical protein